MSLIVCKFGGSSLSDGNNIARVAEIVKSDPDRRYVVVSAPGKRFSEDTKVTDMLYACFRECEEKGELLGYVCGYPQAFLFDRGRTGA